MRKHNGQRLEVSEIESHLRKCLDNGADAVVELVQPLDSPPCIAAFIQRQHKGATQHAQAVLSEDDLKLQFRDSGLASDEVRHFEACLRKFLAPYTVPTLFLGLSSLPLSAAGKIDRKTICTVVSRLHSIELSPSREELISSQNLTPNTQQLRLCWSEVLGIPNKSIGASSLWHRIGGDSIRAMQLSGAMRRHGFLLPVNTVLSTPQFAAMAASVSRLARDASEEDRSAPGRINATNAAA